MKNLKIGIDFDETLVSSFLDGVVIDNYNKKFSKNISEWDLKDYYFTDHDGFHDVYWEYYSANFGNFPFYENAIEVVKNLKNLGHFLYIITSRPLSEKPETTAQIAQVFGENFFEKIIFTEETGEDNKAKIAQNLGCNVVIDDAQHHIERYKNENNLQIIQFLKGWNCETETHERVKIVKNWLEIENFLTEFAE